MVYNIQDEEPPIHASHSPFSPLLNFWRALLSVNRRERLARRLYRTVAHSSLPYIISVALVAAVTSTNVVYGSGYRTGLNEYVSLEPKAKLTALQSIDRFSPFIEENRDAEPILLAELLPSELVISQRSAVKITDTETSAIVAEPVTRETVVEHVIATGETLSDIAAHYDLKMGSIQVENKLLTNLDYLKPGETLRIPPRDYDPTYIDKVLQTAVKKQIALNDNRAVVVRGTSTTRYEDSGQPDFRRPAGALGRNGYHSWAVDIPPSGGTTIYASSAGVVVEVASGWNGGYGNKIVIDHGSGWQTLYSHLASISVGAGETVGAGEVIGVMGATGRTYPKGAVHLHFEIRKNGARLNPLHYLQ